MSLTVGQVTALTVKGIDSEGGVKDAIFKNHAYLKRLKAKEGIYSGEKKTFPFNYLDDASTTGSYYQGAENLTLDMYDPLTELSFDLIELQESLVITHRDLARNSGKEARLNLIQERLKLMETSMRQRFTKGIFSDGTAATGALTTKQFPGIQAFLKSSSVNYGGVTDTDVSVHVAYVNSNSGTARALTTALHQATLGGSSEGEEKPSVVIMRQNVMNEMIELIKPHQRTTRESTLNGLGHSSDTNTLVYSGIDHIIDNLAPTASMAFLNEKFVRLYTHPEYNMKRVQKEDLETMDAMLQRLYWKGVYACSVLRFNGWLKDLTVSA
jgi:hypothetical protein